MSLNSSSIKIALPYAEALIDSSQNIHLVDETANNLSLILESVGKSERLKSFLANPLFPAQVKKNVLSELFVNQVSCHVINFLHVLVDRRRIALLDQIIRLYLDLADKLKLVLVAEVITAFPLNELQKEAVQSKLKHVTNSSKIRLTEQVNTDLIGGLIIKIGSKVIDMSIRGQLNQISSYLNRARI